MRNIMNFTWRRHVLYWIIYALYFYLINLSENEKMDFGLILLTVPYFAFVFYMVYYLLEKYFRPRKYLPGVFLLLLFYTISSLLIYMVMHGGLDPVDVYRRYVLTDPFEWKAFFNSLRAMHGQFTIGAVLYYQHVGKLRAVKEKLAEAEHRLQVERERRQYEFAALAGQVSPHLLANIFHTWSQKLHNVLPEMARQMTETYELMKFYMKAQATGESKTVLLRDEIKAVERFIAVQRETRTKPIYINSTAEGNLMGYAIPPTTLLTLVENAFKHGDLQHPKYPLVIAAVIKDNVLMVTVRNRKRSAGMEVASHGYGLDNLRRRLEIVYADRAQLEITETETAYKVTINIIF